MGIRKGLCSTFRMLYVSTKWLILKLLGDKRGTRVQLLAFVKPARWKTPSTTGALVGT